MSQNKKYTTPISFTSTKGDKKKTYQIVYTKRSNDDVLIEYLDEFVTRLENDGYSVEYNHPE